eukprot:3725724-Prymnesium_polylepis.1
MKELESLVGTAEAPATKAPKGAIEAAYITSTPTSGVPVVVLTVGIVVADHATAIAVTNKLIAATASVSLTIAYFAQVAGGIKVSSTPTIITLPGTRADAEYVAQVSSSDPSGFGILPGTQRLVPMWQLSRWMRIKAIWSNTIHAHKEIPVHDVDPSMLPCLYTDGSWGRMAKARALQLLAGATHPVNLGHDTVPLMRDAPLNCDGTVHQRNDGKPMRRNAIADPSITPRTVKAKSMAKAAHTHASNTLDA